MVSTSLTQKAMPTYRAYTLNAAGKITWGDWIEADDLAAAERRAHELCDEGHPTVELWQGARKVGEVVCRED
ncbi:MAG: hypothetical protein JSR98_02710 [Proteobacteria bacterium]|nr:hypothetical protein [Pseudomonadota bacterium]